MRNSLYALLLLLAAPLAAADAPQAASPAAEAAAPAMPEALVEDGQTIGPKFAEGEHCAGYAAQKNFLFGGIGQVVAKNPGLKVSVEAEGDKRRVVVSVPVDGFISGSSRRDKDVAAYLGGKELAPVIVSSDWLAKADFDKLAGGAGGEVPGTVKARDKEGKVTLKVSGGPKAFVVRAATSFPSLGLPKFRIFGGLVATVEQPLTLTAQIQMDKVIMPAKK